MAFLDETGLERLWANVVNIIPHAKNAGSHNSIYRGACLGSSVTDAQWASISAGTFDDLYIGDYWTINNVNYRIAAFDYYYNTGNPRCLTHHVTLVPDSSLGKRKMNSSPTASGGYVGTTMYTETMPEMHSMIIGIAFGLGHVLEHRQYLSNAVTDGYVSGGSWYDSSVDIMTERNVFGSSFNGNVMNGTSTPNSITVDKTQYPLFMFRPDLISIGETFWLRDVANNNSFTYVGANGTPGYTGAAGIEACVRPAFSIIG